MKLAIRRKTEVGSILLSLGLGGLLLAPALNAQDLGEGGLSYGMAAELSYDDNIFRSESQEVDSIILQASPFITGTLYNKGNTYQATYRLNYAEYFDSSDDSYDEHIFSVDINHRFTSRHAIRALVRHSLLNEQRGTGFSEEPNILVDSPDSFDVTDYELTYLLGAQTSDIRFELSANRNELNFDSSYVGDTRDYSATQLGALMRYRIGARTDFLLEYRNLDIKYDNTPLDFSGQPVNLDSDEDYYLVGLGWDISAKTKGEVKVGHSSRDYNNSDFSSSNFHWEVELSWRPKSYSEFIVNTGRESLETFGSGRFINVEKHTVTWNHAWSARLSSRIEAGLLEDSYEESSRVDDRTFWQLGLVYELFNWASLGAGFKYNENDSTFSQVDYEQNIFYINTSIQF